MRNGAVREDFEKGQETAWKKLAQMLRADCICPELGLGGGCFSLR
jgi:hypothetical protein